ncbi:MAG: hypothetical protein GX458_20090 [Phyllobacteriaceae bacterium]|nr:hypothetical protein [Phyllobacteriaceae bacterium]
MEDERRRAAEAALAAVARDGEVIGSSAFARTAQATTDRVVAHFSAADASGEDAIEVWGRRIGRGLALLAVGALLVHLVGTYGPW